ncbi:MAG: transcriptional regulator [Pedobacter sp.]
MNCAKKHTPQTDWHPADIKAALAKKGFTFARIAREHGYRSNSPNSVLWTRWRPMERIVADIIGVAPEDIWPSRYGSEPQRFITRKKSIKSTLN